MPPLHSQFHLVDNFNTAVLQKTVEKICHSRSMAGPNNSSWCWAGKIMKMHLALFEVTVLSDPHHSSFLFFLMWYSSYLTMCCEIYVSVGDDAAEAMW